MLKHDTALVGNTLLMTMVDSWDSSLAYVKVWVWTGWPRKSHPHYPLETQHLSNNVYQRARNGYICSLKLLIQIVLQIKLWLFQEWGADRSNFLTKNMYHEKRIRKMHFGIRGSNSIPSTSPVSVKLPSMNPKLLEDLGKHWLLVPNPGIVNSVSWWRGLHF